MSRRLLRAVVVGAGQMGRLHARVVAESDQTDLLAIVDPDPSARRVADLYAASWYPSLDALAAGDTPDFAVVTVPTALHAAVAGDAVAAGLPVLVEKPIADSVDDALELIARAAERGVLLGVGHVERFNPAFQALQERVRAGTLGRVFQVHARRLSPFPPDAGDRGVATDLATHDLDLMCELAGSAVRISAELDSHAGRTREDLLAALLRFESGVLGVLEVNWLTPTKVRQLTVTGEHGMLVLDYLNQHLTLYEGARERESWETLALFDTVSEGNVTRLSLPRVEPLRAQLEAFAASVRGEQPLAVDGELGLRALRLALAAVEAGRAGTTVRLDPPRQRFGPISAKSL